MRSGLTVTRRRLIARGDLPGSNGGIYNPGAAVIDGRLVLLCRREIDFRFSAFVFPQLVAIDPDTWQITDYRTLLKVGFPEGSRIEDFRCLAVNDRLIVVHSLAHANRVKPVISHVDDDVLRLADPFDLPFCVAPVEKNWVLFEHQKMLHTVYRLDPLTIAARDESGAWCLVKQESNGWARDVGAMLRNSANLIPFEAGYLGFWHTILGGRYIQGAYWLDGDLTLRYRTDVLLDGADIRDGVKPGTLYVSSLVSLHDRVFAFYGEADEHVGVATFDAAELWEELRGSPFVARRPLRLALQATTLTHVFRALQVLQDFSTKRGHPRIELVVPDATFRKAVAELTGRNIVLQPDALPDGCDGMLSGATGELIWLPSGPPPWPQRLTRQ